MTAERREAASPDLAGGKANPGACPSDGELEQLLAGVKGAAVESLEAHVAGCAGCQRRLVELNPNAVTLPSWPVNAEMTGTVPLCPPSFSQTLPTSWHRSVYRQPTK